jgi:hypothetical protein
MFDGLLSSDLEPLVPIHELEEKLLEMTKEKRFISLITDLMSNNINVLSSCVSKILLDQMVSQCLCNEGINPNKYLNCIKWLDEIYDYSSVTDKLLQTIYILPFKCKCHVIKALPDILTNVNETIQTELIKYTTESVDLLGPVLECISYLNIKNISEIHSTVLSKLNSANVLQLPQVVHFLLHTSTKENIGSIIDRMRMDIDMREVARSRQQLKDHNLEMKLLNAFRFGIRFHQHVKERFLNNLKSLEVVNMFDILIIILLHSLDDVYKRKIESLLISPSFNISCEELSDTCTMNPETSKEYYYLYIIPDISPI